MTQQSREVKVHMAWGAGTACSRLGARKTNRWDRVTCQLCLTTKGKRRPAPEYRGFTGNGTLKCRICGMPYRDHEGFQTCGTPATVRVRPMTPSGWRADAACLGTDVTLWFLEGPSVHHRKGKAICGGCSVRVECAEYATRTRQPFGLWAGTSVKERQKRRTREKAA